MTGIRFLHLLSIFVVIIILGFLQSTEVLSLFHVKPNAVLVLLITASFFITRFFPYLLAVFFGILALRTTTLFDVALGIIAFSAIVSYFVGGRLPGRPAANNILLILVGTLLFYAVVDSSFILAHPMVLLAELLYNGFMGTIFFIVGKALFLKEYEEKIRTRI